MNKSILIADDTSINREILYYLIKNSFKEIKIFFAENGKETIETYKNNDIDLILLDVQMPIINGLEVTRIIRNKFKDRTTNILIFSGNILQEEKKKFKGLSVQKFLSKPFDKEKLLNLCKHYLSEKTQSHCSQISNPKRNTAIFDKKKFLARMLNDYDIANEILSSFSNDIKKQIESLGTYILQKDFKEIEIQAHSIKGAAANTNAEQLAETAREIELSSQKNDYNNIKSSFNQLKKDLKTLEEFINRNWSN